MRMYLRRLLEKIQRVSYLRTFLKRIEVDFKNVFESLNLDGIESWNEQQQQSETF